MSSPSSHAENTPERDEPLGRWKSMFVGGRYVDTPNGRQMTDQMYVQCRVPRGPAHELPIVMIHGSGQTGVNFETTPDGRPGWAEYFVTKGFTVYIVDQPARGRSNFNSDAQMPQKSAMSIEFIESRFTAPENFGQWAQAALHTQWPGTGQAGDPYFDQFYASQVREVDGRPNVEELIRNAGAALLDEIGPAILLTHSQSGPLGWIICDERPGLVKAVLAVEPGGPPFFEAEAIGPPDYFRDAALLRPYGITATAITYDPPISEPSELGYVRQEVPDGPGLVCCHLQQEPARKIKNLVDVPVLVINGEASNHAAFGHCTVRYLRQGGVDADLLHLGEHGVHGNAHMMMLELNNLEVAGAIYEWLAQKGFAS